MTKYAGLLLFLCECALIISCAGEPGTSVTVPMTLDHNRMLVNARIQRRDGTWRSALLWVDTGSPDFIMSPSLARDLGIDLSAAEKPDQAAQPRSLEIPPPDSIQLGSFPLHFDGVKSKVVFQPFWLFSTMHCDANLPATVLKQYQVVFDYPGRKLTLAKPGTLSPSGIRVSAAVDPLTGIVQIDASIDGELLSLALDNGAAYSYLSGDLFHKLADRHPAWPRRTGAVGCANIWGWWPEEPVWPILRVPEINWGGTKLESVGIVGLPNFFANGATLGEWYSKKTAKHVDGFLGPNAFKRFRVEIDYSNSTVYFTPDEKNDPYDLDLVGLTLQPQADSSYLVIGIAEKDGKPTVEGVDPGDLLLQVDTVKTKGGTMGTVVDALRGKPGEVRTLILEREGKQFTVRATVERLL